MVTSRAAGIFAAILTEANVAKFSPKPISDVTRSITMLHRAFIKGPSK